MSDPKYDVFYEAAMDATAFYGEPEREELPTTPAEEQLYAQLTVRLLGAMQRVGMTHPQISVVIDEFLAASRELAEAIEDRVPPAREEPAEKVVHWTTIPAICRACRRNLGFATVPDDLAETARESVCCPGCLREGR